LRLCASGALTIGCRRELKQLTGAKAVMSKFAPSPYVDHYVEDGDALGLGTTLVKLLHTPGHTPDHIALYDGEHVFTGDVLLIGGTGRTDFAGGDAATSFDSITEKLFTLPGATVVLPGHDYRGNTASTIQQERETNPRLAGKTRDEYVSIMSNLGLPLPEKIMEAIQVNAAAFHDDKGALPKYSELAAVRQLSPAQVEAIARRGDGSTLLLDVRTADELAGELGCIEGGKVVNIPVAELASRVSEIESFKQKQVVTICRAGVRSTSAAAILTGLGFRDVKNMRGGMIAFRAR
jgi:sulfur dioxygenase